MDKLAEQLSNDIAIRAAQKLAALNGGMEKDAGVGGALLGGLGGGVNGAVGGALNGAALGALKALIYDQLIKGEDASWDLYAPNLKWGAGIGAGLGGLTGATTGALGGHIIENGQHEAFNFFNNFLKNAQDHVNDFGNRAQGKMNAFKDATTAEIVNPLGAF